MVRTKADSSARKAVAAKAPRKVLGNTASSSGGGSSLMSPKAGKYAGGNPACDRPTPDWQKDISNFFNKAPEKDKENSCPNDDDVLAEEMEAGEPSSASGTSSGAVAGNAAGACAASEVSEPDPESQSANSESSSSSQKMQRNGLIESDSDEN